MAIQDLLKSFGQRLGSGLTQVGGYDPMQQVSPEEAARRRLEGLSALQRGLGKSAAILSGDPRRIQLAEQQAQQAEQDKALREFVAQNPQYAQMYKLFGPKGVQSKYISQLEAQQEIEENKRIEQALNEAGFTSQEKALYFAGMKPKDIFDIREDGKIVAKTIDQIKKESLPDPMTVSGLENMNEAFGAGDAAEQLINEYLGPLNPFGGQPFKETSEAVTARNILNEKIREKFVNQYSGRPSVYLNQRIDRLLPQNTFMDAGQAANQYKEIKRVMVQGTKEMESKLKSGLYKDVERIEVENNLSELYSIINDIDIALSALPQKEVTFEAPRIKIGAEGTPVNEKSIQVEKDEGRFDSVFTGGG
jgi:hypothetical protein